MRQENSKNNESIGREEDKIVNQDDFDFKGFDANFGTSVGEITDDGSMEIYFADEDEKAQHLEALKQFQFDKYCYCKSTVLIADDTPVDLDNLSKLISENFPRLEYDKAISGGDAVK